MPLFTFGHGTADRDRLLNRATTVFCSESVWWRCHRRMIADFAMLSAQLPVRHLMHDGRVHEHRPTGVARIQADGLLIYDAAEPAEPPSTSGRL
jgi:hypothetical protein